MKDFERGNFYHLYNRGNAGQDIFLERENYRFFLQQMGKYFQTSGIETIAYCLMPNHFHILVFLAEGSDVSGTLQSFLTSYVKSFHRWHRTSGHLFEGPFQAKLVDSDEYLALLARYIHLNPVRARLAKNPEDWEFSNYRDWLSDTLEDAILFARVRNPFIGDAYAYRQFVENAIEEERAREKIEQFLFGKLRKKPDFSRGMN